MVGHRQIQPHQLEQRADQPLGLAQRLVKHCPQDQRCLDGEIRVARLTARRGPGRRPPRCDRLVPEPDRQRAALSQPGLVVSPVRHLVAGFGIRWRRSALYLCGMVRQSDQEGARLLSNIIRPGNRRIRAPKQQKAPIIIVGVELTQLLLAPIKAFVEIKGKVAGSGNCRTTGRASPCDRAPCAAACSR